MNTTCRNTPIKFNTPSSARRLTFLRGPRLAAAVGLTIGTQFIDTQVAPGTTYDYRVTRTSTIATLNATGHVAVGVNASPNAHENRGSLVLVVDSRFSTPLSLEIAQLTQDLGGDGWLVIRHDVDIASQTPEDIHAFIRAAYEQRKSTPTPADDVRSVLLFGHIPVPYGWAIPDGHLVRAVPADSFYGDMDHNVRPETTWTDVDAVDTTHSWDMGIRNVPGDGIFDQSYVPDDGDGNEVELSVGRVDMHMMGNFRSSRTLHGGRPVAAVHDQRRPVLHRDISEFDAYQRRTSAQTESLTSSVRPSSWISCCTISSAMERADFIGTDYRNGGRPQAGRG